MPSKDDVQDLIRVLGNREDSNARACAAEALGKIGDARAVEPLCAALKDRNPDTWAVRCSAAEALAMIGDARAVEPLCATFTDGNGYVHWSVSKALKKFGSEAVGSLCVALKDRYWSVRCGAAEVLGEIGDARAVEPLRAALKDIEEVREAAAKALGKIRD